MAPTRSRHVSKTFLVNLIGNTPGAIVTDKPVYQSGDFAILKGLASQSTNVSIGVFDPTEKTLHVRNLASYAGRQNTVPNRAQRSFGCRCSCIRVHVLVKNSELGSLQRES